ncbi:hypothetical protein EX87_06010 [Brevibacillus laterosporus]|uniref:Uncharacterized protein n=1 Tax=Brevibacillus laterosporus TaxID=1465 RepID=A0A0F6XZ68_BRELA|nr:hypothetical protein EX87_06010 [Brevibacillus laterosporus]
MVGDGEMLDKSKASLQPLGGLTSVEGLETETYTTSLVNFSKERRTPSQTLRPPKACLPN